MRILLISPWDKGRRRYRSRLSFLISYPPLTLPTLAALVPPELSAEILVYDEISDKKPPQGPFDLVAITVITSESLRAYELADYYRESNAFVVLGGYHVTFLPEEALEHGDAVVTGEGLIAWPKLLREFAKGELTGRIYDDGDEEADVKPIPRRDVLKSRSYAPVDTVIASRGCPNNCMFCAIRKMGEHSRRPVDEVINELRGLKRKFVIFYDPNFFADRARAMELLEAMEPLRLRWGAAATIEFGFDEELMDAAKRAGCNGVLIGFESLNTEALKNVNKKFCDPGSYRRAVENIHRRDITVNGTFVIGLDEDRPENLVALPAGVLDIGVDLPIFFILTPVPGNALYDEFKAQGRILTDDWSRYTQADVVFRPKNMSPEGLFVAYERVWRESYSFSNMIRRVFRAPGASFRHRLIVFCMNLGFKFLGRDRRFGR